MISLVFIFMPYQIFARAFFIQKLTYFFTTLNTLNPNAISQIISP